MRSHEYPSLASYTIKWAARWQTQLECQIARGIAAYYNPIEPYPQPGQVNLSIDPQKASTADQRALFIARTLVFIQHNDKLLLLKGAPHKRLWANLYNGIGGHIEQGESIREAALREIREEVGLTDIRSLNLRAVISIDTNVNSGILIFVFTAQTDTPDIAGSLEGDPEWVDWTSMPSERMVADLPELLPRILSRTSGAPPLLAHYRYDAAGTLITDFGEI
jgi:8-oxo-dGTP diphosphatase